MCQIADRLGVAQEQAELFAQMPQQVAELSEVNQVLNAKVQKRTMKLAQVNQALQPERDEGSSAILAESGN